MRFPTHRYSQFLETEKAYELMTELVDTLRTEIQKTFEDYNTAIDKLLARKDDVIKVDDTPDEEIKAIVSELQAAREAAKARVPAEAPTIAPEAPAVVAAPEVTVTDAPAIDNGQ